MKLFLSHPRLAAIAMIVVLSLSLTPAASAQLTDFLGVYPSLDAEIAVPHGTYDRQLNQAILVSLRGIGLIDTRLGLDVTVQAPNGGTLTRTYTSNFLDLKNASYEIAEVLVDSDSYIIFLNKFSNLENTWASWVIKISSETLILQWARELTYLSDGISYLRVRDAVATVDGYAVLADLDAAFIGGRTGVAMLDTGSGAMQWTGQYFLSEAVELLKLEYGGFGLRALGWLTDPDSENFSEVAILSLSSNNGALLNAAHYPGAYAFFDVGTATAPPYGELSRVHYLGAYSGFGDVLFLSISGSLEAQPGVLIDRVRQVPSDFVVLRDGGLVAQIEGQLGASLLSVPGPLQTGSAAPFTTRLDSAPGIAATLPRSLDPTGDGVVSIGSTDFGGVREPYLAASQGTDFRSCLIQRPLAPREQVEVETIYFKDWTSMAPFIESSPEGFFFYDVSYPAASLPCF